MIPTSEVIQTTYPSRSADQQSHGSQSGPRPINPADYSNYRNQMYNAMGHAWSGDEPNGDIGTLGPVGSISATVSGISRVGRGTRSRMGDRFPAYIKISLSWGRWMRVITKWHPILDWIPRHTKCKKPSQTQTSV